MDRNCCEAADEKTRSNFGWYVYRADCIKRIVNAFDLMKIVWQSEEEHTQGNGTFDENDENDDKRSKGASLFVVLLVSVKRIKSTRKVKSPTRFSSGWDGVGNGDVLYHRVFSKTTRPSAGGSLRVQSCFPLSRNSKRTKSGCCRPRMMGPVWKKLIIIVSKNYE